MSTIASSPSIRRKEVSFPVSIEWLDGRRVSACVKGKPPVCVAPPPVFRGTDPELWSPEDLLVAAAASCLAVTFTGLAERARLDLPGLRVDGEGSVGDRDDGTYGFTRLGLRLRVIVPPVDADLAHELALQAENRCLVSASLDVPVDVSIDVRSPGD